MKITCVNCAKPNTWEMSWRSIDFSDNTNPSGLHLMIDCLYCMHKTYATFTLNKEITKAMNADEFGRTLDDNYNEQE
tara:strand:+ start:12904 stop:13134 length:231 start_codon:yes stop_codon:yes gene_type:complete